MTRHFILGPEYHFSVQKLEFDNNDGMQFSSVVNRHCFHRDSFLGFVDNKLFVDTTYYPPYIDSIDNQPMMILLCSGEDEHEFKIVDKSQSYSRWKAYNIYKLKKSFSPV